MRADMYESVEAKAVRRVMDTDLDRIQLLAEDGYSPCYICYGDTGHPGKIKCWVCLELEGLRND